MSAPVQPVVHTPGPWNVSGTTIRGCRNDLGRTGVVADTAVHHSNVTAMQPEHEANARLIAAAPDMFRIIQRLATADWIGESELNLWRKECLEIMRKVV